MTNPDVIAEGDFPSSRQVKTKYGVVEGRRLIHGVEKEVDAFQGIPFAKPPVGKLRFELPQPPEPWEGVKETKAFALRSQQGIFPYEDPEFTKKYPVSEDSLYLNVFTPCWKPESEKGFPVLVYIHGGAFLIDSSIKYGDICICRNICRKDVVCVTIQYRLGLLGFMATGDDACPDNLALWDMTEALKWVKENIAQFNGDPDNVTIMGQSAGVILIDLFTRYIAMAGNATCAFSIHEYMIEECRLKMEERGVIYKGNSKEFIEELRRLPADAFNIPAPTKLDRLNGRVQLSVGPRIDGKFFPKPLAELRNETKGKPHIVGMAGEEGLLASMPPWTVESCRTLVQSNIAGLIKEKVSPTKVRKTRNDIIKMLVDIKKEESLDAWCRALVQSNGDVFCYIDTQKHVLECAEMGREPCYFYSFDYYNPDMFGPLGEEMAYKGSTHCCDITYALGTRILADFKFTELDQKITDLWSTLITNFVKYSDPNGPDGEEPLLNGAKWEPVTIDQPQKHLAVNKESKVELIFKIITKMMIMKYESIETKKGKEE
ncbi:hypothetical protein WR25_01109 [Diploscapter pachys]|uniref:Carboxylesterase type B domain-containing protein n=1 Tax=Diploscapter pachys TaxID=2018661 RepID=A0A2A2LJ33_9BILA|nr:hypothetical protein WR25_01109 [Diploscapter pachys]